MHWYKRYPDAALAGMVELTLEERGAYNSILDLLYSRDGEVPDDDATVARMIGVSRRTWTKVKSALMKKGKLWISGSNIACKRVEKTLNDARTQSELQSKRVRKRWEKTELPNENNDPPIPPGNTDRQYLLESRAKSLDEREVSNLCPKPASDDAQVPVQETGRKKRAVIEYTEDFETFWRSYPDTRNNSKQAAFTEWRNLTEADRGAAVAALPGFAAYCRSHSDYRVVHCERFLRQRRFDSFGPENGAKAIGNYSRWIP